jgi:hypothetical protein
MVESGAVTGLTGRSFVVPTSRSAKSSTMVITASAVFRHEFLPQCADRGRRGGQGRLGLCPRDAAAHAVVDYLVEDIGVLDRDKTDICILEICGLNHV